LIKDLFELWIEKRSSVRLNEHNEKFLCRGRFRFDDQSTRFRVYL